MTMQNSTRCEMVATNVSPDTKLALENEARLTGISMSRILNEAIVRELRRRGYAHLKLDEAKKTAQHGTNQTTLKGPAKPRK